MITIYDCPELAPILKRREMQTVADVPEVVLQSIERVFGERLTPETAVARLLSEVRSGGDEALRAWTQRIDHVELGALEVAAADWAAAYERLDDRMRETMDLAVH